MTEKIRLDPVLAEKLAVVTDPPRAAHVVVVVIVGTDQNVLEVVGGTRVETSPLVLLQRQQRLIKIVGTHPEMSLT